MKSGRYDGAMRFHRIAFTIACAALVRTASAQEDVPFVTTPDHVTVAMLELAKVRPEDFVMDLGSGDGRIVITAAKRFGARGLGVEIDPQLVEKSRKAAQAAGVSSRALFREQDLFKTDLSPASVITLYLLPEVNMQLRPKLLNLRPGTRIVSHDWDMGDWPPDRTVTLDVPDKQLGREKLSRVHLWVVPAHIDGAWCGVGKARGTRLEFTQRFQKFEAQVGREAPFAFQGHVDGAIVRTNANLTFTYETGQLKATYAAGKLKPLQGAVFRKPRAGNCR